MYESYWHLRARPFESCADPQFYYPAETHQAALLKLRYVVENARGGAVLAGPAGCGKTLLVNMLRAGLAERFSPLVHLVYPHMPYDQLLAYLAGELTGQWAAAGLHESVRHIERFLADNTRRGRQAVVVFDEAHLIEDPSALEALRLLLNFQWAGQPGMALLLVGQPGILPTLDRVPHFEERLGVRCLLRPFTETETAAYVAHRLRLAGSDQPIFAADAIPVLHQLTAGLARRINRLCDMALLIGYAEEWTAITAGQLEAISEELVTVLPE